VAGKWDPVKGPEEIMTALKRLSEILQMDRRMALDAIAAFDKEYPELAWTEAVAPRTASSYPAAKFRLLLLAGKNEEAAALGAKLVERGAKYGDPMVLNEVAWFIVDPKAEVAKRDLDMAMNAATKAVELSKGEDGGILDTLARVYSWKGDLSKAIEIQTKAVEKAAGNAEMLADLQDTLEEYKAEAAAKKKE
jgi:tetratricopeptide (TPR) repeat protein